MKEELIRKLFKNASSPEEIRTLFNLIEDDPTPPSSMLMKKLYESIDQNSTPEPVIRDRVYANILSKIDTSGPVTSSKKIAVRTYRSLLYPVAASLVVLIGLAFWLFGGLQNEQVVRTNNGQQHAIELSDGSKVRLNANSQLVYNKSWSSSEDREVWLEGEAFFEVEKKPAIHQKFQVITKDLTIEVLGTTFNVNSYRGKTSVYLEEGSIRLYLNHLDTILLMKAGDLIVYSVESNIFERRDGMSSEYYPFWKDNVLMFSNASLREVLEKMEETYGVQFKVTNASQYEREINYPLPINDLQTAITILKRTVDDLAIRQEGNIIYLE